MPAFADDDRPDPRSFMHGIDAVSDGKTGDWVFFSSSGLPPQGEDDDGNWTHDIYIAHWQPGQLRLDPHILIGKPEAQEPVDAARSDDGHILVTFEDGYDTWGEVEQRLTLYDGDLKPIIPYYKTVSDGGHSGHVASVGNRFVVFYSDEWIKGGGVDNLGSGNGVYVAIYDSNGKLQREVPIVAHKREWWPMIAASPTHALLVWQAFIKGETAAQLKCAMLDPATGTFTPPQIVREDLQYYTYAVRTIPALDRFVLLGTARDGRGFAYLIDGNGNIVASIPCMPAVVREAGIVVVDKDVFMPSADNRLLQLHASESSLALAATLPSPIKWDVVGSVGLQAGPEKLHWISLGHKGLSEADFDITKGTAPTPRDMCR